MSKRIVVLNEHYDGVNYVATYKYWIEGECACTAQRVRREFEFKPTLKDLEKAI